MTYKRKRYLVDLPFQLDLILRCTAIVFFTSIFIGIGIFMFTQASTTVAIENARVYAKSTADFIFPVLLLTVLFVSASVAAAVIIMTLFISHRIVGPVVRLKKEIDMLKKGSLKRNFTTRRKDKLKDLSRDLQEMSDVLYGRHSQLKNSQEALDGFLQGEEVSMSPLNKEKLSKLLRDLKDSVDYFKS